MSPAPADAQRANKRQQLPDEVAAYVRELILSGKARPGDFLRMEPIAAALGVSNTPVREGLLTLRSEGFVRLEPRRGFVVASFTPQDVRDIFWAQAQFASELAARATKLITPEELDRLDRINDEFGKAVENHDEDGIAKLGVSFHVVINRAAHSHRLALLLESVSSQLPAVFYATIEGRAVETRKEHLDLAQAIRSRQVCKVRTLAEQHMLGNATRLVEILTTRHLWEPEAVEKSA